MNKNEMMYQISIEDILKEYKNYNIKVNLNGKEGHCWCNEKIIEIGLLNENPLRLLLHEIAHIKTNAAKNKHNQQWFDVYKMLIAKIMPNTDISKSDNIIKKIYRLK